MKNITCVYLLYVVGRKLTFNLISLPNLNNLRKPYQCLGDEFVCIHFL